MAVCHPHYFRNISTGGSANCRLLGYIIPVLLFSFLFNLPRFFETEFEYTVSRLFKQCELLSQRHSQMATSQGYFPKWPLPKWQLPKGIFPSGHFPNVQFPKRQLPKSVLAAALSSYCSLQCLRRPNLTFGKLSLGKFHIKKVATSEILTWKVTLG